MTRYINKADVVAEIERLREEEYPCDTFEESTGYYNALDEVSSFLDTLEVKEIDLDEEFNKYCENLYLIDLENEPYAELFECAKHFFKLGLNAPKGE